jgi:ribosome maturation factor RimP
MDQEHDFDDQLEDDQLEDDQLDELDDAPEMTAEEFAAAHPVFTPTLDPRHKTVDDKILALVRPIVADMQLELYDFEFKGGIVKITIDTPPGTVGGSENRHGGVTLDQLALVTRLIGRDLDHHDPIPSHYTLEVSSPGLERNLRTPTHFQREIGKSVTIRLRTQLDGQRRFNGVLVAADDTTVTVRLDEPRGTSRDIVEQVVPIELIDRAKTVFEWEKGTKGTPTSPKTQRGTSQQAKGPKADRKGPGKNSPKRSKASPGGVKPPKGPSDELDSPIQEEATA